MRDSARPNNASEAKGTIKPGALVTSIVTPSITLADVQACLGNSRRGMLFPPPIEAAFETSKRAKKTRMARQTALSAALIYSLFIPYDFIMVPKTAWLSWDFHAFFVTPFVLLMVFILRRPRGLILRNSLSGMVSILMIIHLMTISALNSGTQADQYQYWPIITLILVNVIQRLDFRFALISTTLIMLVYSVAALFFIAEPASAKISGVLIMLLAAVGMSFASLRLEWEGRLNYLLQFQAQLQLAATEAKANRDPLTGLSNRRHYDEQVARLWQAAPSTRQAAIIMLDIDHFKAYNDHYGHAAGDTCLQRLASVLQAELRSADDLAVRFGGEEFLVLLPDCDLPTATGIAERIRRAILALAIPHQAAGAGAIVTASMGVHAGFMARQTAKDLARGADGALYAAKRKGRNQVQAMAVD